VNTLNLSDQTNPIIAIGDNDVIHVTWQDVRNGNLDIYMSNSTNGGSSFNAIRRVDSDTTNNDQTNPTIAADVINGRNYVLIAWSDQRNLKYKVTGNYYQNVDVYFAFSSDDGASYSTDYCIHTYQGQPVAAVADDGTVYAVWCDYRFGDFGDIYFAKSYTGGQYFDVNIGLVQNTTNRGRENPDMAYKDGVVYVVWDDSRFGTENKTIVFTKSTDGGVTFSDNKDIVALPGNQKDPALVVDKTGKIHVVWEDNFNPGVGRSSDVFYSNSVDNGTSWSTPERVNSKFDNIGSWNPCIAVNNSGTTQEIYVAYMNESTTNDIDISIASSTDGGSTFTERATSINDDITTETQANPAIDVDSSGNIGVVWEDYRSTNDWDIYFIKFQYEHISDNFNR
jgi:hypothetical protein